LAVLRIMIGLTQKEMGDLVNRAAATIQAVEMGKLQLSEGLACRIAEATGVELGWLLDRNPTAPPRKAGGDIYTQADYEHHRASLDIPAEPAQGREEFDRQLVAGVERLLTATAGSSAGRLVRWKLRRRLTALSAEHGGTSNVTEGETHN
jgi:transcriptional regulator with XRE-family HTH domain